MNLPMSFDGGCLAGRDIAKMARLPKQRVRVLVVNAQPSIRYVSLVEVGGRQYWADRVTGSLYHPDTGRCVSSPNLCLDVASLQ